MTSTQQPIYNTQHSHFSYENQVHPDRLTCFKEKQQPWPNNTTQEEPTTNPFPYLCLLLITWPASFATYCCTTPTNSTVRFTHKKTIRAKKRYATLRRVARGNAIMKRSRKDHQDYWVFARWTTTVQQPKRGKKTCECCVCFMRKCQSVFVVVVKKKLLLTTSFSILVKFEFDVDKNEVWGGFCDGVGVADGVAAGWGGFCRSGCHFQM